MGDTHSTGNGILTGDGRSEFVGVGFPFLKKVDFFGKMGQGETTHTAGTIFGGVDPETDRLIRFDSKVTGSEGKWFTIRSNKYLSFGVGFIKTW